MEYEYYVLVRDMEYRIIATIPGNDPLYGNGSWNLFSGPYNSYDEAYNTIPGA